MSTDIVRQACVLSNRYLIQSSDPGNAPPAAVQAPVRFDDLLALESENWGTSAPTTAMLQVAIFKSLNSIRQLENASAASKDAAAKLLELMQNPACRRDGAKTILDGYWGPCTRIAVVTFQRSEALRNEFLKELKKNEYISLREAMALARNRQIKSMAVAQKTPAAVTLEDLTRGEPRRLPEGTSTFLYQDPAQITPGLRLQGNNVIRLIPGQEPQNGRVGVRLSDGRTGWVPESVVQNSITHNPSAIAAGGDITREGVLKLVREMTKPKPYSRGRMQRQGLSEAQANEVADALVNAAKISGMPVFAIASLCLHESGGYPGIPTQVVGSSATGLCQITRSTWAGNRNWPGWRKTYGSDLGLANTAFTDPAQGATNVRNNTILAARNLRAEYEKALRLNCNPFGAGLSKEEVAIRWAWVSHFVGHASCRMNMHVTPVPNVANPTPMQFVNMVQGIRGRLYKAERDSQLVPPQYMYLGREEFMVATNE